jgi:Iron-containing redox enzyme
MMLPTQQIKNSDVVRAKIELSYPGLHDSFDKLWQNSKKRELTISYLLLLHQVMRASVPLMLCASDRCSELEKYDGVAALLGRYYSRHIAEELHHDTWALEDLEAAGLDPDKLLSITPSVEVARLVGCQYYWVKHHHPLMLLGYIAVLEAFPPSMERIDWIRDMSGLPESAFRTLRIHGELDPTHSAEIDETFDSLPLNQQHMAMVGLSVLHSCEALAASVKALQPVNIG